MQAFYAGSFTCCVAQYKRKRDIVILFSTDVISTDLQQKSRLDLLFSLFICLFPLAFSNMNTLKKKRYQQMKMI